MNNFLFLLLTFDEVIMDLSTNHFSFLKIFYNLEGQEKFAIVQPPLPGIILYSLLKSLYHINNISVIPSGSYFGLVSFIYALETPKMIGSDILSAIGTDHFKMIRYFVIFYD